MTLPVRSIRCPSCNAPLQVESGNVMTQCPFCKNTVEIPGVFPSVSPVVVVAPSISMPASNPIYGRVLVVGVAIALLTTAMGVFWAQRSSRRSTVGSPASTISETSSSTEASPPKRETDGEGGVGAPPPVSVRPVVWALADKALVTSIVLPHEQAQLVSLHPTTWQEQWRGPLHPLEELTADAPWTFDEENLYFLHHNRLTALRRDNGNKAWGEAVLTSEIADRCKRCLQAAGGAVVVLTKDGVLQGISASQGTAMWSLRFKGVALQIYPVGKDVAVVDMGTPKVHSVLAQIDAQTGKQKAAWLGDTPGELRFHQPIVIDENQNALYHLFAYFEPLTLQKWQLSPAKKLWRVGTGARPGVRHLGEESEVLLGEKDVFFSTDRAVYRVEKKTGAVHKLMETEEGEIALKALAQGTLLVQYKTEMIGGKHELWGIDAQTGKQTWRYAPQAPTSEPMNQTHFSLESLRKKWWWTVQGDRVWVLQQKSGNDAIQLEAIHVKDGTKEGERSLPLTPTSEDWFVGMGPGSGLFVVQEKLQQVDFGTGAVPHTWPSL